MRNFFQSLLIAISFSLAPLSTFAGPTVEELDGAFSELFTESQELCSDATFLRRLSLCLRGRIPSLREQEVFAAHPAEQRRIQAIDAALASEDFAARGARLLSSRLLTQELPPAQGEAFERWLGDRIGEDMPLHELALQLVAREGPVSGASPAGLFLLQFRGDPGDLASAVARQFLSRSIDCARCHDHPFDSTPQSRFHDFAASFARLRIRPLGTQPPSFEIFESPIGDYHYRLQKQDSAQLFKPRKLDGEDLSDAPRRRLALTKSWFRASKEGEAPSDWLRAQAQRIFESLFGATLNGGLDELGPASDDPKLLRLIAQALVESSYRQRPVLRLLLQTRAWQRAEVKSEAGLRTRRALSASDFLDSVMVALDRDQPGAGEPAFLHAALRRAVRAEARALEASAGEGAVFGSSRRQALSLLNSPMINGLTKAARGRVLEQIIAADPSPEAILGALWRRALARPPRPEELERWRPFLSSQGSEPLAERCEDLFWALIASREFAELR